MIIIIKTLQIKIAKYLTRFSVFVRLKTLVRRLEREQREEHILKNCGCIAYCPKCNNPLQDQVVDKIDQSSYRYTCDCGNKSEWNYDIAPTPICTNRDA